MMNHIIQLAYDEFCRRFLGPLNRTSRSKRRTTSVFNNFENADDWSTTELSDAFTNAVNVHKLIPSSMMASYQHEVGFKPEDVEHKLDVAIFPSANPREHEPSSRADQTTPVVFVKPTFGADPFAVRKHGDPDEEDDVKARCLKQISSVVELLFVSQHRVAVFMLFVIGRHFRVARWDRAGIIITPAIDYFDNQVALCGVLGQLSALDPAALGFDPSATRILPGTAEFLRMDSAARKNPGDIDHTERNLLSDEFNGPFVFEYVRTLFRESLANDWPRYRLEVSSGPTTRCYLVGKPTFIADGLVGRGTRGYVAMECETGHFVWLKDVWRMSHLTADQEGDTLRRLNVAGIDGVPTLVCHGDVLEQVTMTSAWSSPASTSPRGSTSSSPSHSHALRPGQDSSDATVRGPLPQHTHYRIVVKEICLSLDNFTNGKQLVSIVLDTLRTHCQVTNDPQIRLLHCDISSGNLMIYPKIRQNGANRDASLVWTGILSDWELVKPVDDKQFPSRARRLGTYQFMSINLLQEASRPVQISDELESFFHVLLYYAVRHLRSTCDRPSSWITDYFYRYYGQEHMGRKLSTVQTLGRLESVDTPGPLLFFSPLDDLFFIALQHFKAHYKVANHQRQQAHAPPPAPTPPSGAPRVHMNAAQRRLMLMDHRIDKKILAQLEAEHAARARSLIGKGPSAEEQEQAAKLLDHTFMLAHLEKYLNDPRWSDDDRIPPPAPLSSSRANPQPSANPQPIATPRSNANAKATEVGKRPLPAESSGNGERAAKRQRTSKPKPARKPPVPARASTHAMRTRSQARRERAHAGARAG